MNAAGLALLVLAATTAAPAAARQASTELMAPALSSPPVKRGVDLWNAGNHAGAVAAWLGPADAGDADAQFNLGQAYKLGRGVPLDQRQAEAWYRKAAQQGHEQAGGFLGLIMFQNGDRAGALPWLMKASDRGDPRAQYVYGTALFNGEQVQRDWPRAYALMTRSAAAGLPQARSTLTQMDQFIPLPDRQAGLKMAADMARTRTGGTVLASSGAIATTPLPPSVIATPAPTSTAAPRMPTVTAQADTSARPTVAASADTTVKVAPKPEPRPVQKPKPTPVKVAKAPPAVIAPTPRGGWRVQLGAYGSEQAARAAWAGVRNRAPRLAALSPNFERAGAVVRLKLGPLGDRAGAARACAAAKAAGSACFAVAP